MIPQFSDLKFFLMVCETKNISRASERLGVVQPTVTQAMKRLENAIGAPLFLRLKTGVELTQEGQTFKKKAQQLLHLWHEIGVDIKQTKEQIQGNFKIGCHPSVALYTLTHFLPQLIQENAGLEIKLIHGLSRDILEKVISFEVDFGFVINPKRHPDLVLKKLISDRVGFWVPDTKAITEKGSGDRMKTTLLLDPDLHQSQVLLKKITPLKLNFERYIESSNLEVIGQLVESGCGVGLLPSRVAQKYNLKPFNPSLPCFQDELYLIYRADFQKTMASQHIIQQILKSKF